MSTMSQSEVIKFMKKIFEGYLINENDAGLALASELEEILHQSKLKSFEEMTLF